MKPEVVVAPKAVLRAVADVEPKEDPLQLNDPWAQAVASKQAKPAAVPVSGASSVDLQAMSRSLEAKLSAQVQAQVAEANRAICTRVQAVEATVAQVSQKVDHQEQSLRDTFEKLFQERSRPSDLRSSSPRSGSDRSDSCGVARCVWSRCGPFSFWPSGLPSLLHL